MTENVCLQWRLRRKSATWYLVSMQLCSILKIFHLIQDQGLNNLGGGVETFCLLVAVIKDRF